MTDDSPQRHRGHGGGRGSGFPYCRYCRSRVKGEKAQRSKVKGERLKVKGERWKVKGREGQRKILTELL